MEFSAPDLFGFLANKTAQLAMAPAARALSVPGQIGFPNNVAKETDIFVICRNGRQFKGKYALPKSVC